MGILKRSGNACMCVFAVLLHLSGMYSSEAWLCRCCNTVRLMD